MSLVGVLSNMLVSKGFVAEDVSPKEKDINKTSRDLDGHTPLTAAAFLPFSGSLKALLRQGADVNSLDERGRSAIFIACSNKNLNNLQILLSYGARTDIEDQHGFTPLQYACFYSAKPQSIKMLIDHGADANCITHEGRTALYWACGNDDADTIRVLLEDGVDIEAKTSVDWTALHASALNGHLECAKLLIKHGAKLDNQTHTGDTPLHLASMNGHTDFAKYLLKAGANVFIKNEYGYTPLDVSGSKEIKKILRKAAYKYLFTRKKKQMH